MRHFILPTLLAGLLCACTTTPAGPLDAEARFDEALSVAASWHSQSKAMAKKVMEEYGPPDQILSDLLVWNSIGPWRKIAVWDTEDYGFSDRGGPDTLEQTLSYAVPRDKRKDLADFSDEISVSKEGDEVSVRGNSEALNFLVLNLAHEIVQGAKDPADARLFYDRVCQLSQAGKSSPYTQGLLFSPREQPLPPQL
jgi:hypothetical protein